MADFAILKSPNLISRKIWVIKKSWNLHILKQLSISKQVFHEHIFVCDLSYHLFGSAKWHLKHPKGQKCKSKSLCWIGKWETIEIMYKSKSNSRRHQNWKLSIVASALSWVLQKQKNRSNQWFRSKSKRTLLAVHPRHMKHIPKVNII